MNATTYHVLCTYAGDALLWSHPWPVPAALPFPLAVASAVYVVLDGDGRCCYVGSVRRVTGTLADRLAEHLADPVKRALWHTVRVVPLRPDVTATEARRVEGVVGAHLGPYGSRQLPAPRLPRRSLRRAAVEMGEP